MLPVNDTMLQSIVRRNIFHTNVRQLSVLLNKANNVSTKKKYLHEQSNISLRALDFRINSYRRFSSDGNLKLPKLLDQPLITSPALSLTIKNFFIKTFLILPQIDGNFNINEFKIGAKHAIIMVSNALANQQYDLLDGLVEENLLYKLKNKINGLSWAQRRLIAVNEEDIGATYIYEIKAGNPGTREKLVTVTIVIIHVPGAKRKIDEAASNHESVINFVNYHLENSIFLNYTFVRKYVDGEGGPWIINMANHFSISM